ncbi:MAG: hypothetical protein NTV95_03775 [Candidatus Saccharibacteria bacterium]|nr:hypothetical protein [Candidatus Saccharibacteria bacterium]
MEDESSSVKSEPPDKTIENPVQATDIQTQQQDNILPPKKGNKNKALLLIFIPLLLWAASFGLLILDLDKVPTTTTTSSSYSVVEVKQNPILTTLNRVNFLLGPVLLGMLIYGVVLLFKKPFKLTSIAADTIQPTKMPVYKTASITLLVGFVLLLIAFIIMYKIRSDTGYSGSESEIASIPFIFSGAITVGVSILMYTSTKVRRITIKRKGHDLKKTTKLGVIVVIVIYFLLQLVMVIVKIRSDTKPMSKNEVIKLINNCEVYNVNREIGNKVIVNYKDKGINKHRTNAADAKYFDEYAEAAKNNKSCEVQINDRLNETTPY